MKIPVEPLFPEKKQEEAVVPSRIPSGPIPEKTVAFGIFKSEGEGAEKWKSVQETKG